MLQRNSRTRLWESSSGHLARKEVRNRQLDNAQRTSFQAKPRANAKDSTSKAPVFRAGSLDSAHTPQSTHLPLVYLEPELQVCTPNKGSNLDYSESKSREIKKQLLDSPLGFQIEEPGARECGFRLMSFHGDAEAKLKGGVC